MRSLPKWVVEGTDLRAHLRAPLAYNQIRALGESQSRAWQGLAGFSIRDAIGNAKAFSDVWAKPHSLTRASASANRCTIERWAKAIPGGTQMNTPNQGFVQMGE